VAITYVQQVRTFPLSSAQASTTGSFNASAGDIIVACAMIVSNLTNPVTISDSTGGALTWTKRLEVVPGVSELYVVVWTTTVGAAQTGMTITYTRSAATSETWLTLAQLWRGATGIGVGNTAKFSAANAQVTLTGVGANSAIAFFSDDNTAAGPSVAYTYATADAGTFTPGASMPTTSLFSYAFYGGYYADAGAAGTKVVGVTDPTAQVGSAAAIEILGGPGNPTVTAALWENGVFKQALGTATVSADGVVSFTWNASVLTALSGANVELRLTSDLGVDIGAVEWNAIRQPTVTDLSLPGVSGNYASTPDSVAASITGDLDMRMLLSLPSWTGATGTKMFISKCASAQLAYRLYLSGTFPVLAISGNGTTANLVNNSVVGPGFTDGEPGWLRSTFIVATGAWTIQSSLDGLTWTTLGSGTGTPGAIFDSTAPLQIGQDGTGLSLSPLAGVVKYAEVRNGINGPVVAKFDPSAVAIAGTRNPSSLVSSTGETWTINGTAWDWVLDTPYSPPSGPVEMWGMVAA
jgi:hypothetical protein